MKNAPKWTPEFLERCAAFEKFMGWCEGVVIDDLMNAIRSASRSALEDGMRNSYLYISYDGDVESIDLGSYRSGPVRSNRPQRRHGKLGRVHFHAADDVFARRRMR